MNTMISLVALMTFAVLVKDVVGKDCYIHGARKGGETLNEKSDSNVLLKCSTTTLKNSKYCMVFKYKKEVDDANGNKVNETWTRRYCDSTDNEKCREFTDTYKQDDKNTDLECYFCTPNKCNSASSKTGDNHLECDASKPEKFPTCVDSAAGVTFVKGFLLLPLAVWMLTRM